MSTEVEQQPTVAPINPIEESIVPAAETTTAPPNGETKTEEKKNGHVKEPTPPKDPLTDTAGWLLEQHKPAVHKAAYLLLDWMKREVYTDDDPNKPTLPESGFVRRREFVEKLKDGVLLGRFANTFEPNSLETIKEGEDAKVEENQKANVDGFINFAKKHLPDDQVFTFEDLKKGKEEFLKIFVTLFQLMVKSPAEKFKQPGGDYEHFVKEISEIVPKNFMHKLQDKLKIAADYVTNMVRRPFKRSNSNAQPEQPAEQNGTTTANGTSEVAHEENGVPNGTKVEEKKEETPAVAAN